MRYFFKTVFSIAALGAASLLAGCLSLTSPLFETGVRIYNFPGILACANKDGQPYVMTVAQRPTDPKNPKSFAYRAFNNSDGSFYELLFEATSSPTLYLVQARVEAQDQYYYIWYDGEQRTFMQVGSASDSIKALAARNRVELGGKGMFEIPMRGPPSGLRAFLNEVDKQDLELLMRCSTPA